MTQFDYDNEWYRRYNSPTPISHRGVVLVLIYSIALAVSMTWNLRQHNEIKQLKSGKQEARK